MSFKKQNDEIAQALRKAGYLPLPRWWVRPDELDVIRRMAHNHQDHVTDIKKAVRRRLGKSPDYPDYEDSHHGHWRDTHDDD